MTGAAKQQFSEVLRRSAAEPQLIYRRDQLVAAVISAETFAKLERCREASGLRRSPSPSTSA